MACHRVLDLECGERVDVMDMVDTVQPYVWARVGELLVQGARQGARCLLMKLVWL